MAYLYIVEFSRATIGAQGESILAPDYDHVVARQPRIAISGVNAASAPLSSSTRYVQLHVDTVCSIGYGAPGTVADPAVDRFGANETRFVGATGGNVFAVIATSP